MIESGSSGHIDWPSPAYMITRLSVSWGEEFGMNI
jgi:hypothetical protein